MLFVHERDPADDSSVDDDSVALPSPQLRPSARKRQAIPATVTVPPGESPQLATPEERARVNNWIDQMISAQQSSVAEQAAAALQPRAAPNPTLDAAPDAASDVASCTASCAGVLGAEPLIGAFMNRPSAMGYGAGPAGAGVVGAAPLPMYSSSINVLRLPGFTEQMRQTIPNPNGSMDARRADAPYGPQWVAERRARQLLMQHDLIIQFVYMVAARTGTSANKWWTGDIGDQSMLEMMVSNAIAPQTAASMAGEGGGGGQGLQSVPTDHREELKAALERAADVGNAEYLRQLKVLEAATLEAVASGNAPPLPGAPPRIKPRAQTELDALAQQKYFERDDDATRAAKAAQKKEPALLPGSAPGAPAIPSGPSTTTPVPPSATLNAPRPKQLAMQSVVSDSAAREQLSERQRREQEDQTRAERSAKEFEEKIAKKDLIGTFDANGRPVYGIGDGLVMAMRLMLDPRTTQTQLQLLSYIYGIQELSKDAQDKAAAAAKKEKDRFQTAAELASTPEGRLKYARDQVAIHRLIHSGEGGPDWTEAPQHTGYVFFDPRFAAAVRSAMTVLRSVCRKGWALEVDLMTQSRVCSDFADLVAYYLTKSMTLVAARFVSATKANEQRESDFGYLLERFKLLVRDSKGMLGFRGEINERQDEVRRVETQQRQQYLALNGRYFSDQYDYQ